MGVKISDINIACDAALDQDISQEIDILGEDEWKAKLDYENMLEQGVREAHGVCKCCNGTGHYMDCDPHSSRYVPCDICNGTGFLND